jgi:mono/diheme cytochrome c family protein
MRQTVERYRRLPTPRSSVSLLSLLRTRQFAGRTLLAALAACAPAGPGSSPPPAEPATAAAPEAAAPAPAATPTGAPAAAPAASLADPYHPPPRDTVEVALYKAWQQYSLQCARCHGEDGQGTSFGPSLLRALRPDGDVPTREEFLDVLIHGRQEEGMPSAANMGLDSVYFAGLYDYLKGRSDGRLHGGRPARRES